MKNKVMNSKKRLKRKDCEVTYEQAKRQVEENSPKSNTKVKYSVVVINGEKCLKREEYEKKLMKENYILLQRMRAVCYKLSRH